MTACLNLKAAEVMSIHSFAQVGMNKPRGRTPKHLVHSYDCLNLQPHVHDLQAVWRWLHSLPACAHSMKVIRWNQAALQVTLCLQDMNNPRWEIPLREVRPTQLAMKITLLRKFSGFLLGVLVGVWLLNCGWSCINIVCSSKSSVAATLKTVKLLQKLLANCKSCLKQKEFYWSSSPSHGKTYNTA